MTASLTRWEDSWCGDSVEGGDALDLGRRRSLEEKGDTVI